MLNLTGSRLVNALTENFIKDVNFAEWSNTCAQVRNKKLGTVITVVAESKAPVGTRKVQLIRGYGDSFRFLQGAKIVGEISISSLLINGAAMTVPEEFNKWFGAELSIGEITQVYRSLVVEFIKTKTS